MYDFASWTKPFPMHSGRVLFFFFFYTIDWGAKALQILGIQGGTFFFFFWPTEPIQSRVF